MAKTKKHTSLYNYLDQSGLLESNDDALIQRARVAYWKNYHKQYKREKRGKQNEHTLALTKKEEALIAREAAKHQKTISVFLKTAALAYTEKKYLLIPQEDLPKIQQQLSHIYVLLETFGNEKTDIVDRAIESIERIESSLMQLVSNPPELGSVLRQTFEECPEYIIILKQILLEYDH